LPGVIVNPRGPAGAGKTELARRIMAGYGWRRGDRAGASIGRGRALVYRLPHPSGGRPLAVLGDYEAAARGGCDTIRAVDGGLDEAFRLAGEHAARGYDVLLEGLHLSAEHARSAALAAAHGGRLHVLRLATPADRCVRNLMARRRARRDARDAIARAVAAEQARVEAACERLRACAAVEVLGFEDALARARALLGLQVAGPGLV
jgi:hypothetical protein